MTELQAKAYEKDWENMTKRTLGNLSAAIRNTNLPHSVRTTAAKELLSMEAFVLKHQPEDWHKTIDGIKDRMRPGMFDKFLQGSEGSMRSGSNCDFNKTFSYTLSMDGDSYLIEMPAAGVVGAGETREEALIDMFQELRYMSARLFGTPNYLLCGKLNENKRYLSSLVSPIKE